MPVFMDTITTANGLHGHKIERELGLVRGLSVRSRNLFMTFFGDIQSLFGGNISIYRTLSETSRSEAYKEMIREANKLGATGIIAVRYESNDLTHNTTEIICYGTAVKVHGL